MPLALNELDRCAALICDCVQSKVLLVVTYADPNEVRKIAADVYMEVRDFCDRELAKLQGPRDPLLRRIETIVAELFRLTPSDMRIESRVWPKPAARGMMFLLLHETGLSLKRCSEMAGVSASTIKYKIRMIRDEMSVNPELSDIHKTAKTRLRSHE